MNAKVTMVEIALAGLFGLACFWAPTSQTAAGKGLFAALIRVSTRLEGFRRSRWQWLTMVGTMIALRVQRQLPVSLEFTVGGMFLILLAYPVRELLREHK